MGEVKAQVSVESAEEAWRRGDEHREFWQRNHKRFAKQHPAEYVAVESGEVLAHSPSLHALVGYLEGIGKSPHDVFLEYMAVSPASLMPR